MNISNNTSPNFGAKFVNSASLRMVADYAVEHGKFDKLNEARKNIDRTHLTTRIRMDFGMNSDGTPCVMFTRFVPKKNVIVAHSLKDCDFVETVTYDSSKKMNPIKFAYEKIIKLGNNLGHNKMYERVIMGKK